MNDLAKRIAELTPEKRKLLSQALQEKLLSQQLQKNKEGISQAEILPHERKTNVFPLSFAQWRLWFLNQWDPGSAWYNMPGALHFSGPLHVEALEQSLVAVVQRHEALRTTFATSEGQPVQVIAPDLAVQIPVIDLHGLRTAAECDQQVKQLARNEAQRPFDLLNGPLLRAFLLRTGKCPVPMDEQEHVLLFTLHHIIADGWSMEVLVHEMTTLYQALMNGKDSGQEPPLPALPIQYADYTLWQRSFLQGEVLEAQMAYWRKQLADLSPLTLPTDHPRGARAHPTGRGTSQSRLLPQVLLKELLRLCQRQDVTLFMLLLSAFQVMLMRYTGQTDISVGTPIANRRVTELEGLIGFFVNTLVMRTDLSDNPTFLDLLHRVREVSLGAYAHQDIPFEKVVEEIEPARDLSRSPLFQVMFALQRKGTSPFPTELGDLAGARVTPLTIEGTTSKFDLTLFLTETVQGLDCVLEYSTDLFEADTITRMLTHFQTLLEGVLQNPQALLSDLPLLTDVEREQVLAQGTGPTVRWNATQADYPQEMMLHQLFERQVERTPDSVALAFGEDQILTYTDLNRRANLLAHHLQGLGIGPDHLVGLSMVRSIQMVVGLLGVLKAGGAYVPIDPSTPPQRFMALLQNAGLSLLVTQQDVLARFPQLASKATVGTEHSPVHPVPTLCLDELGPAPSSPSENLSLLYSADQLAYVMYTSGSTGQPKGVAQKHRSLVNLLSWQRHHLPLPLGSTVLQFAPVGFDVSCQELFSTWHCGGTLLMIPEELRHDPEALLHVLAQHKVERLFLPPVVLQQLAQVAVQQPVDGLCIHDMVLAGEQLHLTEAITTWVRELKDCRLHNHYGPTETHVVTSYTLPADGEQWSPFPPIGSPIANTQIYILDAQLQLVPPGVPGDLYIGGDNLARAYLHHPDWTAERFIPHPFVGTGRSPVHPGARLYRTGDLARYRPDGTIEYLGRTDSQVKMRGFRIELGEIEATLRRHPAVQEAVVVLYEEDGDRKALAVYVVPLEERPRQEELQSYLREHLPDYMVPATFVYLETLPLTPNGKVNRKALPIPARTAQRFEGYVAPQSELEQRLSEIWQEVLGIQEQVSTTSNFFDLGGHSLLIIQVRSKLQGSLGYEVPVVDLFQYPTIAALSTHLSGRQEQQSLPQPRASRVRKRKAALHTEEQPTLDEGLAIVGLAGRFPGARNLDEFWQNLCNSVESISVFSAEELLASGIAPDLVHDPKYVKARAILDDVESFDAAFFGYSPKEAATMDPQQRLFLECAWEVLEQAGYNPDTYEGLIGVYAGQSASSYLLSNLLANPTLLAENNAISTLISNDKDYLATRTCYKLNLKGPGITIQTACSTSLVAVNMACQGLLHYECDMALAGGVSIGVPQKIGYLYEEEGILSPDGHCRAFDAEARGTVTGSGVGIVALKRLSDAMADGDTIYAVIRGSAINNDGASKVGYTAPSVEGQVNVITEAMAVAGVEPETISYIETHGTGTSLGDPIEIAALTQAFRTVGTGHSPVRFPSPTCAIGSVKTNLGHLDAAAGIAGLIKTVLSLKHGMLPPSLHFHRPNPKIDFAKSPFYVNTHLTAWNRGSAPRRAGVSSFGIGGTNAHVILEEAPSPRHVGTGVSLASHARHQNEKPLSAPAYHALPIHTDRPHLVLLSAKTASALETMTERLATYVKAHPDTHLADMAYTLQIGRKSFPHRRAFVVQDPADMLDLLSSTSSQATRSISQYTDVVSPETKQVAFLFPGQGTQYVNMGRELYEQEPTFRDQIDTCARLLVAHLHYDLREILYPPTEEGQGPSNRQKVLSLHQTDTTQSALFVIEYALAQLLMTWGIHPQAMIGHSLGEYVAACLAGVFSLEDALALVALRGRLMQALPVGAMLSVMLPEQDVEAFLGDRLTLAACNGAHESVVSGTLEAIEQLEKHLLEKGIACVRLQTSHASHSPMMEPIIERFTAEVSKRALHPPKIPYLSNLTGTWITDQEATNPAYWAQHLRQTVRFNEGMQHLLASSSMILLEVGPGHTLSTLARWAGVAQGTPPTVPTNRLILPSLRPPQTPVSDRAFLLNTCGRLWCAGVNIDWSQLYADEQRRHIPLPTYPFERQRYWISPQQSSHQEHTPLRPPDLAKWFSVPSWKRSPLPPVPIQPEQSKQKDCWLIFTDPQGLGTRLGEHLRGREETVITVKTGAEFRPDASWGYTLRPESREDYDTLLKDIDSHGLFPTRIVHLWTVIATDHIPSSLDYFETAQALGFYSLLFLTQALGEQYGSRPDPQPQEITLISNNLQEVIGGEMLCPVRATALGVGKVAPHEYSHITFRSIDIVFPVETVGTGHSPVLPTPLEQLVKQIIAELRTPSSDVAVAYRGLHRWVQCIEPVQLPEVPEEKLPLRQRGVYLITGGLGGIGLALAEYLARQVRARLVLTGRTALPPREEWDDLWDNPTGYTSSEQDAVASKIRQVKRLEELGAEVLVMKADVTDLEQMQAMISQLRQRFGDLHGVIHTAGTPGGGLIQLKTPEVAAGVLAPKVKGTLVLETVLKDLQLDFIILCSSLSTLTAEVGQVDYCAANTFLDSFAFYHTVQQRVQTLSINWDAWQGVGMAVKGLKIYKDILGQDLEGENYLQHGMLLHEGIEAFRRILSYTQTSQVIVSTTDIFTRLEQAESFQLSKLLDRDGGLAPLLTRSSADQRPNLQTPYVAPQNETQQQIAALWQKLLDIEKIGIHDNFLDLGGHSLLATQLITRLRDTFQVDISLHTFLEKPTVAHLAVVVLQKMAELVDDTLLLQEIEDVERLTDDEAQTFLAVDTK